jgi:hypothetical protein
MGQQRGIGAEADALVEASRVLVGRGQQSTLNALQERRTHRFTGEDGGDTPAAEWLERRDAGDLGEPIERGHEGPGSNGLPIQAGEKGPVVSPGNVGVPGSARVHADGRTGTGITHGERQCC